MTVTLLPILKKIIVIFWSKLRAVRLRKNKVEEDFLAFID
tara:strand:- start:281 stop:400 length:120 start_codon:yes stop_codon:yes gene_type:complete